MIWCLPTYTSTNAVRPLPAQGFADSLSRLGPPVMHEHTALRHTELSLTGTVGRDAQNIVADVLKDAWRHLKKPPWPRVIGLLERVKEILHRQCWQQMWSSLSLPWLWLSRFFFSKKVLTNFFKHFKIYLKNIIGGEFDMSAIVPHFFFFQARH